MSLLVYLIHCVVAMESGERRHYSIVASGNTEKECEIKALKVAATFHEVYDTIIVESKELL